MHTETPCATCFHPVAIAEAVAIETRRRTTEHHHRACWYKRVNRDRNLTRQPYWARRRAG